MQQLEKESNSQDPRTPGRPVQYQECYAQQGLDPYHKLQYVIRH